MSQKCQNHNQSAGKWLSVSLMILCLVFLTSINYFIYPPDCSEKQENLFGMNSEESENNFPPQGPTEEKSSSTTGSSLAEEMLHEMHAVINFEASNLLYLHYIHETEKIEIFHPEILLPPPKVRA